MDALHSPLPLHPGARAPHKRLSSILYGLTVQVLHSIKTVTRDFLTSQQKASRNELKLIHIILHAVENRWW